MALIFDPDQLPEGLRGPAWIAAITDVTARAHVELANPEIFRGRLEWWQLDDVDVLTQWVNSGLRVRRTASQTRRHPSRTVSIAVMRTGVGRHEQFGVKRLVKPGHLVVTDLAAPYEYTFEGESAAQAIQVDLESLALSADTVRRAAARLESSPLCAVVDDHIADVTNTEILPRGAFSFGLGDASVSLIRALLTSAAMGDITRNRELVPLPR